MPFILKAEPPSAARRLFETNPTSARPRCSLTCCWVNRAVSRVLRSSEACSLTCTHTHSCICLSAAHTWRTRARSERTVSLQLSNTKDMANATVVEADPTASDGASSFSGLHNSGWSDSQLRQYPFQTRQIPRLSHTDPRAEILIDNEVKLSPYR